MKVIDRTNAVTQHFLEKSFKKLKIKKKQKNAKNTKIMGFFLLNVYCVFVLYVF